MNNRQQLPNTVDIVVIAALKEELDFLREKKDIHWCESIKFNDFPCEIGTWSCSDFRQNLKIAAAYAEGMGLVDAAILATTAILCWQQKPKLLAMIGICGGRKKSTIDYGDIVVPELTYLYQFGSYENGEIRPRLKTAAVQSRDRLIRYMREILDPKKDTLDEICNSAFARHLHLPPERLHKPQGERLKAHFEPMGSADLVVKDDEKIKEAILIDDKAVAVEMEAYAVLRTANLLGIDAIIIKSVSDFCGGKNDDYKEYAKFTATEAFYLLVKKRLAQENYFEHEGMKLKGATGVDYTRLRDLLAAGKWKDADQETANRMLEVANRKELNGEDIVNFPCEDLRTIDQLWRRYSSDRFGFSVQKDIYIGLDGTGEYSKEEVWEKFGDQVGWRKERKFLKYSDLTFEFRNTTPGGHLPILRSWQVGVPMSIGIKGSSLASLVYRLVKCGI